MMQLTLPQCGAVARRCRQLYRKDRITAKQLALVDCFLWSCRNPATGAIVISYSRLEKLANMARATIAEALRVLERLGVLTRIKRFVDVVWHQGGSQRRQAASAYVLHPPADHCEFNDQPVIQRQEILTLVQPASAAQREAQAALAARRRRTQEELAARFAVRHRI